MQILVSTTNLMRIHIRYYKSHVQCLNVQCMANHYHCYTKLYRRKHHSFVAIGIVAIGIVTRAAQTFQHLKLLAPLMTYPLLIQLVSQEGKG